MVLHPITPESLQKAVLLLRAGKAIGFPTETVYGLMADAGNPAAVGALYGLKGREETKPCQVLCSREQAFSLGEFSPRARTLAEAFWPGGLTLIVKRKHGAPLAEAVSPGTDTVGLRVPDHTPTQELLHLFGKPLAASSANPTGKTPALDAAEAAAYFPSLFILDGAIPPQGIASTVVDCTGEEIKILREGTISSESIIALGRGG